MGSVLSVGVFVALLVPPTTAAAGEPAPAPVTRPASQADEPSPASPTPAAATAPAEAGAPGDATATTGTAAGTEAATAPASPSDASPSDASPSDASPSSVPAAGESPTPPATDEPSTPPDAQTRPPRSHPRLVLALGPLVGPHAIGNEQCDTQMAECQTKGSFFGVGAQLELRARLYRPLYLHVRGVAVSNVSPNDPVYRGLAGGGIGLGAYGRRAFARAEYLLISAFGDNRFEPPFFDGEVASDEWGNHAGMLAAGFRQPLPRGLSVELWGGPMFGPRSIRRIPQTEPDRRVLTTFMLGINLSWDAWP